MNGYLLLTFLLWPLFVAYTARIAWRDRSWRYFRQRLGYGYPAPDTRPLWIHCASVGEVITVRPLLQLLMEQYPQHPLIISTNTVTGAKLVKRHLPGAQHCYLPIENRGAIQRFLSRTRPRLALVMETELWPLLYRQCHRHQLPICIINGRLSPRTLNSHPWIRARYRDALARVDQVLCRSQQDEQAFIQLGLPADRAQTLGNLKFAQDLATPVDTIDAVGNRPYLLAASTHQDEEYRLVDIWRNIAHQDRLLVIAPRHPQRGAAIMEQLKHLDISVARRSEGDPVDTHTDVYLADTLGELRSFMKGAELVFMGGSLIPHGGQNLLEPAALGKAVIVGPHMHNFEAETRLLVDQEACVQVQSTEQLKETLEALLADDERCRQLGERARALMTEQAPVAQQYLHTVATLYPDELVSS